MTPTDSLLALILAAERSQADPSWKPLLNSILPVLTAGLGWWIGHWEKKKNEELTVTLHNRSMEQARFSATIDLSRDLLRDANAAVDATALWFCAVPEEPARTNGILRKSRDDAMRRMVDAVKTLDSARIGARPFLPSSIVDRAWAVQKACEDPDRTLSEEGGDAEAASNQLRYGVDAVRDAIEAWVQEVTGKKLSESPPNEGPESAPDSVTHLRPEKP